MNIIGDDFGCQCHARLLPMPAPGTITQSADVAFSFAPVPAQSAQSTPFPELSDEILVARPPTAPLPPTGQLPPLSGNTNVVTSRRKTKTPSKIAKPRLRCTHADCDETFLRKYELQRHLNNVHERIYIPCIVYGCNRIAKPVARVDKFRDHMNKHKDAHTFVCAVEECLEGPFDGYGLYQHMNTQHDPEWCSTQLSVKERLRGSRLRITTRDDGTRFVEDYGNCPLSFLGCSFHLPPDAGPFNRYSNFKHLREHDIAERVKGYRTSIELNFTNWDVGYGLNKCPICSWSTVGMFHDLLHHLNDHSEQDRRPHITGIWEWCRLFKKELKWLHRFQ